ncbi:MAG: hotdog fold thioesterase [Saprospiraceae bacterium]
MIWKQEFNLEGMTAFSADTLVEHLGIEYTEIGDDYIVAKMPVDHRTVQPFRILHGGASVALAESLGSVAGTMCLENIETHTIVGLEINANHIRSVKSGYVYGKASPLHVGRTTQIWSIEIKDDADRLVCVSRITLAVITRK